MPMKKTGIPDDPDVTEWDGGFSWVSHPEEKIARASHALRDGTDVWVVDPLDFMGLDDRLAEAGDVAGTVVLFNQHTREAGTIASRHGVSVHVPAWMEGVDDRIDAPIERFDDHLGGTDYRTIPLSRSRLWGECALFDGETLVVPEAVGTATHFRGGDERLGIHPFRRVVPPRRQLRGLDPERVLTGHGTGVFEGGSEALADALAGARRRAPAAYLRSLGMVLPG